MSEQRSSVKIEIYGSTYKLKGGAGTSASHIQRIAAEVDRQMRKIAANFPQLDMPRTAVLAAVNIMDEHLRLANEVEKLQMELKIKDKQFEDEMQLLHHELDEWKRGSEELRKQADERMQRESDWSQKLAAMETSLEQERGQFRQDQSGWERERQQFQQERAMWKKERQQFQQDRAAWEMEQQSHEQERQRWTDDKRAWEEDRKVWEREQSHKIENKIIAQEKTYTDHRRDNRLEEEYRKLKEEYRKLQSEYNEWIQLVEQDHPGN